MSAASTELLPPLVPRFVGREQEFLLLRWQLSDARQGRGSVVVIRGEAGLGKTRLLEELAPLAREQECLLLTGAATADREEVAYGLIAALRSITQGVSRYEAEFSHYQELYGKDAEQMIELRAEMLAEA